MQKLCSRKTTAAARAAAASRAVRPMHGCWQEGRAAGRRGVRLVLDKLARGGEPARTILLMERGEEEGNGRWWVVGVEREGEAVPQCPPTYLSATLSVCAVLLAALENASALGGRRRGALVLLGTRADCEESK